jgi:ubiquinone/menaquinone biosynthesis C-methylase UbiE
MTDPDIVRGHYGTQSLLARLKAALIVFGPEDQPLKPDQLGPLDQFHTLGSRATADLAELAGIRADTRVLDVGSGLGGPARYLAANHGCRVMGIDLSAPFVEAACYLSQRTGQAERTTFEVAGALDLPFPIGAFDVVLLQHVAMNIADRAGLYGELRRVLVRGGRFATFDIVTNTGQPTYPMPWARTPDASFLLSADATRAAITAAGFQTATWRDDSQAAAAWFAKLRETGLPLGPNLSTVMGDDFQQLTGNLAQNLAQGRVSVVTGIFESI